MTKTVQDLLAIAIARAPEWLRHDLAAKDAPTRQRSEEALAAILTDALAKGSPATEISSDLAKAADHG